MTAQDRAQYQTLAAELAGIATRLKEIADEADETDTEDKERQFMCDALARLTAPSYLVAKASLTIREECERP